MTIHGYDRATERIAVTFGCDVERVAIDRAETYAQTSDVDTAARVYRDTVRSVWAGESNGDTVVAIIRNRRVVTYMLRRSTQPFNPAAFNVTRVVNITE